MNEKLKVHPNGILFQILCLKFIVAVKYFVTGISFIASGRNIEYTPSNLRDFGFLPYG